MSATPACRHIHVLRADVDLRLVHCTRGPYFFLELLLNYRITRLYFDRLTQDSEALRHFLIISLSLDSEKSGERLLRPCLARIGRMR